MSHEQVTILVILVVSVAMFLFSRWRHDMVAAAALLACVLSGLLPAREAFSGFGHPAVITVACVLVLSRGLQTSGAVDVLARVALPRQAGATVSLLALIGLGAVLSGFMNNVGAMALLMPVAIQLARRLDMPPGRVLMPLAFGTILGGMTTLIGTPPNLIVSGFRAEHAGSGFAMFDFAPVGLAVAVAGVAFIALLGWRLVPARKQSGIEGFETGAYLTEVRVPEDSDSTGKTLRELEQALDEAGAQVVGLVRHEMRVTAPNPARRILAGDILIIEAEAEALAGVLSDLGLQLEESASVAAEDEDAAATDNPGEDRDRVKDGMKDRVKAKVKDKVDDRVKGKDKDKNKGDDGRPEGASDVLLMELAVLPGSPVTGRSASDLLLRSRYGLNLLAVSRQGQRSIQRLRSLPLQPGDLLLMQGPAEALSEFATDSSCVPLAERELRIPSHQRALQASLIMAGAVALAAFAVLPAAVAFAIGVLASMALRTVPPRAVYQAIDWPVIVLLGALIPVAGAIESTGTADLIARFLMDTLARGDTVVALGIVLVVSMFLSDVMNNAATTAVMCPIAIGTASALGVNSDTFLMAVAIGASCAFLTPIGHQNNTLILGPGGFRFADYWRLGLPLELLVVTVSVPALLLVWPP